MKNSSSRWRAGGIALAVAATLAITSCSAPSDSPTQASNNEITIGTNGDARTINPILAVDLDGLWRSDLIFSPLVLVDPKTLEPIPNLATSWKISDDNLSYTFSLDSRAKFSDGKPLTSADVEFTILQMLKSDYTGPFQSEWARLAGSADVISGASDTLPGITVIDDHTITLSLSKPYSGFLTVMARQLKPLPKHLLEGQGTITEASEFSLNPVGSGQYLFDSWVKDTSFSVVANPDYWGTPATMQKITQLIIPDSNTLVTALQTGEIDATIVAPPASLASLSTADSLKVYALDPLTAEGLYFNMKAEPWGSNQKLREAIATAIDYPSFAKQFTNEPDGRPAASFFSFASWAFDPSVKTPTYNVEKAKQLLADAGYPDGGGLTVTIRTNAGNVFREQELTYVEQQLGAIGITVNLVKAEWGEFITAVNNGDFEIAALNGGDNAGIPDPLSLQGTYITGGSANYSSYSNSKVDELFSESAATTNMDERKALYSQIQTILATDLPFVPGFWRPNSFVVNTKFSGVDPSVIGAYWNIQDWSISG